jgi:hypothetical protein
MMRGDGRWTRWPGRLDVVVWPAALAVVILAPLLVERGFALRGDMVFVPTQWWKPAWLALDGAPPRFVPGDAVLSGATYLVAGDLLQKVVLVTTVMVAAAGAMRLVEHSSRMGRLAAATCYVWNPWVYERLAVGQWGFVVGYAAFPFIARHAASWRRSGTSLVALTAWLVVASAASPPTGLMGAAIAVVVVASTSTARRTAAAALIAAVTNLCWVVPAVLAEFGSASGGQFQGFAARGESDLGTLASLVSLGGIWKTSIVPGERASSVVIVLAGVGVVVACWGLRRAWAPDRATGRRLVVLAVAAVLVGWLPSVGAVAVRLDAWAEVLPGLSLLRDSHRYLAPLALVLASGAAGAVDSLRAHAVPGRGALVAGAGLVVVWPILCLPSLAGGLNGTLVPTSYPREWEQVSSRLRADDVVVVLPWRGSYRGFAWNDHRAVLDPAARYFRATVLVDDRHYLGDRVLGSEQPRLRAVAEALAQPTESARAHGLAALGIDHVLVEKGNGTRDDDLPSGTVRHDGEGLTLIELDRVDGSTGSASWGAVDEDAPWILGAQVAPLGALLVSAAWLRRSRAMMHRRAAGERPLEGTE